MDECELHTHPHLAKVWQRRGEPMSVPAAGTDERWAVFGAVDYASGRVEWRIRPSKDGAGFAEFLEQLARAWPDEPLVLVLDNASYHKTPEIRAWVARQDGRLSPLWLPTYTPKLNLMERVWRYLKQKLACHRFGGDAEGLQAAAAALLGRIQARFGSADEPAIRLVQDLCEAA